MENKKEPSISIKNNEIKEEHIIIEADNKKHMELISSVRSELIEKEEGS